MAVLICPSCIISLGRTDLFSCGPCRLPYSGSVSVSVVLWGSRQLLQQLQHMFVERTHSSTSQLSLNTPSLQSNPPWCLDPLLQLLFPSPTLLPRRQHNPSIISLYVCSIKFCFLWFSSDLCETCWTEFLSGGIRVHTVPFLRVNGTDEQPLQTRPCWSVTCLSSVGFPFLPGFKSHTEYQMYSGDRV